MGSPVAITTEADWHAELKDNGNKLVVAKFGASWCAACQKLQPILDQAVKTHPDVRFLDIDVDQLADLAADLGVSSIPTVFLIKNGKVIDQVLGINEEALSEKIETHKNE
ncbi:unnamed protein product [Acanthoscelides obtectus]|uniref:Thioredoxin n=1 Tax=Acanthoscelides obtectus TaxID=200917 RepID=A0A9P0JJN9_ACAOB|nr:unnamed protein product [Acanthoscelides obtectus]CAK1661433.1 Thioredoxin H4-2 [Acanthoscelides obtectus]